MGTAGRATSTLVPFPPPRTRRIGSSPLAASTQATLLSLDQHLLGAALDDVCAVLTPSEFLDRLGMTKIVPE